MCVLSVVLYSKLASHISQLKAPSLIHFPEKIIVILIRNIKIQLQLL